ncbi:hypothetical protein HAX54_009171 [Datura stramonium]|uniref:Uncharacterized protein n=1 Tax=Datura stramonium TaxID=4076 RepID=A0ABS8TEJ0_DATST|nr:hypothetical protein [Datura stramonium]
MIRLRPNPNPRSNVRTETLPDLGPNLGPESNLTRDPTPNSELRPEIQPSYELVSRLSLEVISRARNLGVISRAWSLRVNIEGSSYDGSWVSRSNLVSRSDLGVEISCCDEFQGQDLEVESVSGSSLESGLKVKVGSQFRILDRS